MVILLYVSAFLSVSRLEGKDVVLLAFFFSFFVHGMKGTQFLEHARQAIVQTFKKKKN
jgi:hypothetical protein